uniref:Myb-like domain-containing protein n=1 Tax=Aplanochytrium stocchinoi TaxID=215587 RepID=A0A7S3PMQ1_9STRA|eukprot:CAMPEP_0204866262 /NCGR_PEP_ID=MMETSP1348-20121228/16667_1 /ASSEMBLY_ACC=CAM_ASM_000700 /TAXON_ID=215587 /ORGANISM="Aplanochytrium stocchinoi, Strain GSBS06" /LENGTH=333 /DNA_ID=CAMNT_0052018071 /DNA_START=52 /DNA_END=1053 /DNA_ORIENTATION=+
MAVDKENFKHENDVGGMLKIRPWTKAEDELLLILIKENLTKEKSINFRSISQQMPERTTKQCREHYENSLAPNKRRGDWSLEEKIRLAELMVIHGQNWAKLRDSFRSRTYNGIKKKGRKFLGESSVSKPLKHRRSPIKTSASLRKYNNKIDDDTIFQRLLELHKEHRYHIKIISTKLRVNKSEAELERMLFKNCQCKTCLTKRREIKALMVENNEDFKESWTRVKALEKLQDLLRTKSETNMNDSVSTHNISEITVPLVGKELGYPIYPVPSTDYEGLNCASPLKLDTENTLDVECDLIDVTDYDMSDIDLGFLIDHFPGADDYFHNAICTYN